MESQWKRVEFQCDFGEWKTGGKRWKKPFQRFPSCSPPVPEGSDPALKAGSEPQKPEVHRVETEVEKHIAESRMESRWKPLYVAGRCFESEAALQGEFYYRARLAGLDVLLEVRLPCSVRKMGFMRADIAVLRGRRVVAIVETKRPRKEYARAPLRPLQQVTERRMTRQRLGYNAITEEYGVPVFWLRDFNAIDGIIAEICDGR